MPVYTVHQPPLRRGETAVDPDRFVFVREGFAFWAFLFAPLWLIVKRLWLALIIYVVAMALLVFALRFAGLAPGMRFVVLALVSLLFGLEAATVQRWTLARRKWTQAGVVVAHRRDEAERRFFAGWVERVPAAMPAALATPVASAATIMRAPTSSSYPIGVFPEPGSGR
jgi:hypothetical protein